MAFVDCLKWARGFCSSFGVGSRLLFFVWSGLMAFVHCLEWPCCFFHCLEWHPGFCLLFEVPLTIVHCLEWPPNFCSLLGVASWFLFTIWSSLVS